MLADYKPFANCMVAQNARMYNCTWNDWLKATLLTCLTWKSFVKVISKVRSDHVKYVYVDMKQAKWLQ